MTHKLSGYFFKSDSPHHLQLIHGNPLVSGDCGFLWHPPKDSSVNFLLFSIFAIPLDDFGADENYPDCVKIKDFIRDNSSTRLSDFRLLQLGT